MANEQSAQQLEAALDVFLNGEAGIQFESLLHFAEPLFELYQVDLRSSLQKSERTAEELATMVAILETARLLWAFFSLPEQDRNKKIEDLERGLLGGSPTGPEERMDFLKLLSVMQARWESMPASMKRPPREAPTAKAPSFDLLLSNYDPIHVSAAAGQPSNRYGPEDLEPAEAQALFARPLLNEAGVAQDPDRLEDAMARANAYWQLAQVSTQRFDEELRSIKEQFAANAAEKEQIEEEAEEMVDRFYELFPEQKDG